MKYLIPFFCLFFPLKHFELFHVLLILILSLFLILSKRMVFSSFCKLLVGLVVFIWLSNIIRSVTFADFAIRDYIEIIRFIPLLLLLVSGVRFEFNGLKKLFFFYVSIDLLISISQFLSLGFGNIFTTVYGSPFHVDASLGISLRALGLSSGPGQHGAIIAFFYLFFLYDFLYRQGMRTLTFLGLAFSLMAILLSQSQTSLIGIIISSCLMIGFTLLSGKGKQKKNSILALTLLVVGGMAFLYVFLDELRYLYTFVELGLERNSFQRRLAKSDVVWDMALSIPGLLLIGYGKDFFGTLSTAMDNEYLYVFFIYGFIIGAVFLAMALSFVIKVFLFKNQFPQHYIMIAFIIVMGLILAFPASFFTEPRIIILLASLFLIKENKTTTDEDSHTRPADGVSPAI